MLNVLSAFAKIMRVLEFILLVSVETVTELSSKAWLKLAEVPLVLLEIILVI